MYSAILLLFDMLQNGRSGVHLVAADHNLPKTQFCILPTKNTKTTTKPHCLHSDLSETLTHYCIILYMPLLISAPPVRCRHNGFSNSIWLYSIFSILLRHINRVSEFTNSTIDLIFTIFQSWAEHCCDRQTFFV